MIHLEIGIVSNFNIPDPCLIWVISTLRNVRFEWNYFSDYLEFNCDEHLLKLVLNCCVTGPELLRAMLIYISAQQFRTRNAAIQDQL